MTNRIIRMKTSLYEEVVVHYDTSTAAAVTSSETQEQETITLT